MSDFVWNFRGYTPTTGGQAAADSASHANVGAALAGNRAGYVPPSAPAAAAPEQPGVRADEYRAQKQQRLAELKARLADIDNKIATLSGTDQEVAAKLASIGNLGVYQQLLSQQQNAGAANRATAQGIENALYQAEGLVGGLKSAASEDREQFLAKIKALQNQAHDRAKASGMSDADFEKLPVNQRVSEAIAQYEGGTRAADETYLAFETDIMKKVQDKALHDADLANLRAKANEYGNNSKVGRQLLDLIDKYKGVTVEAKGAHAKRKSDAFALWNSLRWLDKDEKTRRIGNLTPVERKLLEDFHPDILK